LFSNRTSTPAKAIAKSIVRKYVLPYFCGIVMLEPCCCFLTFNSDLL
jgi:hypothetical protein